jgi:sn-glycerol 3-phosphate transport system permease protein
MLSGETTVVVSNQFLTDAYWLRDTIPGACDVVELDGARLFFPDERPDELAEAARMDGAGPMRFFFDVILPLSKTNIAALFVILFILGWNQYLWPLLITNQESMYTVVIGIKRMISGGDAATEWNLVMATAMLALAPPALVVVLMQKWFVKGLVETEK